MLDVRDGASVTALAPALGERQAGSIASNAAARITPQVPAEQQVRTFVDTQQPRHPPDDQGVQAAAQRRRPVHRGGQLVGMLASLDPRLHHLFDVGCMSLTDLAKVMDDYVAAVETGRAAAQGWPAWINPPSKVGQVASRQLFLEPLPPRRIAQLPAKLPLGLGVGKAAALGHHHHRYLPGQQPGQPLRDPHRPLRAPAHPAR